MNRIRKGLILRLSAMVAMLVAVPVPGLWWTMIRMPGESFRGPLPPLSEEEALLRDALRGDVETLAGRIGERNVVRYAGLEAAVEFLQRTLEASGYEVGRQVYAANGRECVNLDVEIAGTKAPQEIVVVGGHYDSVYDCPGANDNGSGAAATLALAHRFANAAPERTLRFCLFVNEEPPHFQTGTMGSLVYARRCRERNENVVAMMSLETIGYYSDERGSQKYPVPVGMFYPSEGNFIGFVGNHGSRRLVRRAIGAFRQHASFPSEGAALPGFIPGVGWSDHWSFWQAGYEALMITDTAPYRYPHYHAPSDTPDKLDYDRMARVVSGLAGVVEELTMSR